MENKQRGFILLKMKKNKLEDQKKYLKMMTNLDCRNQIQLKRSKTGYKNLSVNLKEDQRIIKNIPVQSVINYEATNNVSNKDSTRIQKQAANQAPITKLIVDLNEKKELY